jgi:hypothetical protein
MATKKMPKKMQKKMQKKNRRQQRTKRVGGAGGFLSRLLETGPYIAQFVQYYADAGGSDDKPKHQVRFITVDAPQLMEYFQKINRGYEPNEDEKDAVARVKAMFLQKEDFHRNYGTAVSLNSDFSKMFMELATVVNPTVVSDEFESKNPLVRTMPIVNTERFSEVNPMIAQRAAAEKRAADKKELDEMEARRKDFEQKTAESNEYYAKIDEMGNAYEAKKNNRMKLPEVKSDANIFANSNEKAFEGLQQLEADHTADITDGGAKKSRRNQRRNQRRNRSRKH